MAKSAEIIPEQTTAVDEIVRVKINTVPFTLIATNLAGEEVIPVYFSVDDGRSWTALQNGVGDVELTATGNTLAVYSPMQLGVAKPTTVGAVGVFQN